MNIDNFVTAKIIELMHSENLPAGTHLSAQQFANKLQVSRSPINKTLALLEQKGIVKREKNRGYFLQKEITSPVEKFIHDQGLSSNDMTSTVYFQIADDLLKGDLPDEFTESFLKQKYSLTSAQLQAVLHKISEEGWAYKKPGYGWAFSRMLTTPESLIQSYRLRLALEPAALLEPGYYLDPQILERCKNVELDLLNGDIESYTADQIHQRGVQFHSSIVEASGNPFFIETLQRVHKIRLLLSYRSMQNRKRYKEQCEQHLHILDLLGKGLNEEASLFLKTHLTSTIRNISEISDILRP